MLQYKKETRDAKTYLGYSWKCNLETILKKFGKSFLKKRKNT